LVNLAVNARDAMPDGGKLTIRAENIVLDAQSAGAIGALAPGAYVRLAVSDTGVGMDVPTQTQLFEPFFTTKDPGQGTGLGLATCYGIVQQHAGLITCASEIGKGTTFDVFLPRVDEVPDDLHPRLDTHNLPRGNERVLLVEDEAAVRALIARVLGELGYRVVEMSNGEEALQYTQSPHSERFDLLLTDVIMPRLGGQKLAEQLQQIDPALRVLFISGYANGHKSVQGPYQRELPILTMPFEQLTLARRVREVLDT
jgi:CheY-like chemotaxis protein